MPLTPMTYKEVAAYFASYRGAFPDWHVKHRVTLQRGDGPMTQVIAFEALRNGCYRPSCSVDVIGPLGGSQLLFRFLDVKHREVSRREHAMKWPHVLKAMEEQFLPDVKKPLELAEVLRLAESEAIRDGIHNSAYLNGLATLSVYAGHLDRAIQWCDKAAQWIEEIGGEPAEAQLAQDRYARQLRQALQAGQGLEFVVQAAQDVRQAGG